MSQSRTRKVAAAGQVDPQSRSRSVAKALIDNPRTPQVKEPHRHRRSKSRIPKSVRYDLENALVGLCDVWFEDIKPHLLRNNIKLHVDAPSKGGPAGGGDQRLPAGDPGCSHLDPGAAFNPSPRRDVSSASSCSTQRTASRVQFRRPVQYFKEQPRIPSPPRYPTPRTPLRDQEKKESTSVSPIQSSLYSRRCNETPMPSSVTESIIYVLPQLCPTYSTSTWKTIARSSSGLYETEEIEVEESVQSIITKPNPKFQMREKKVSKARTKKGPSLNPTPRTPWNLKIRRRKPGMLSMQSDRGFCPGFNDMPKKSQQRSPTPVNNLYMTPAFQLKISPKKIWQKRQYTSNKKRVSFPDKGPYTKGSKVERQHIATLNDLETIAPNVLNSLPQFFEKDLLLDQDDRTVLESYIQFLDKRGLLYERSEPNLVTPCKKKPPPWR